MNFSLGIVCCNKGSVVEGDMCVGGPDGMRMDGTGNLFGYERWQIVSGEKGLGLVSDVGVRLSDNSPPPDG